jgi:hypothetical protein
LLSSSDWGGGIFIHNILFITYVTSFPQNMSPS